MIAFITGATSGIGKATATLFAQHHIDLVITGRRKERLEQFAKELTTAYNIRVLPLCFDVRSLKEVQNAVGSLPEEFSSIDILLNNAGLASGLAPIQDGDIEDWEKMIDTNVKGLLYVTKMIAPLMIKSKKGHIINIGSIAGKEVYANGNVYCASKHAVDALNKAMRIDLLPHGIKVTSVNPGMIETEFSVVRFHGDENRAKKVYLGMQPLMAEDIAETIYWVATRPAHVNINELTIMPTVQANSTTVLRT